MCKQRVRISATQLCCRDANSSRTHPVDNLIFMLSMIKTFKKSLETLRGVMLLFKLSKSIFDRTTLELA